MRGVRAKREVREGKRPLPRHKRPAQHRNLRTLQEMADAEGVDVSEVLGYVSASDTVVLRKKES